MSELIRIAVRVYRRGVLQDMQTLEKPIEELDEVLPQIAEKHAEMMAGPPGHIEIEFLDEPDMSKRFFRMGTDIDAMVESMTVRLDDPDLTGKVLRKWKGLR